MVEILTQRAALVWLKQEAAHVPADQAIVELGVYRGGSLKALCDGAEEGNNAPVYGVDSWGSRPGIYRGRPHMLSRYVPTDMQAAAEYTGGRAQLIHATTVEAARDYDGPTVGLLYIDAEHTQPSVLADFHAWRPHLASSAVVAFDDHEPGKIGRGVMRAVSQLVTQAHLVAPVLVGDRLAVCQRVC